MRKFLLCAMLCACGAAFAAEPPAKATDQAPPKLTGDPDALALVEKVIASMGGDEGLKKRRQLYMEQEVPVLSVTVSTRIWTKGEKQRLEQQMGNAPGKPVVIVYDGSALFLLENGQKRDPGETLVKAFQSEKKRFDIWWDCRTKALRVKSLGLRKLKPYAAAQERELALLEFTHPDNDTTTVGIDPATSYPVYVAYTGPHPQTGKKVAWSQWLEDFAPFESAGGLVFPRAMALYQGDQRLSSAKLKAVKTLPDVPDSLFAPGTTRPID